MLFQSAEFILLFLPAVLLAYNSLRGFRTAREWLLVLASAVFYGWWDVRFLPLMIGQAAITWCVVWLYGQRRLTLLILVIANLAVLGIFKYLNFLTDLAQLVVGYQLPQADVVLPIGISFYTFAILSYVFDLKRGQAPIYGFRRFLLFVMFFPHLIAGPIVRHWELIPQLDENPFRSEKWERLSRGTFLFVVGLCKKVMIADQLAPVADPIFAGSASAIPMMGDAWTGALAFSLQLYFDFSAYSDMAIGLALMFGIQFPDNFNSPYKAENIQDFWRRWHMTLSRFFRDYLYIPLGGSREGALRYAVATLVTFGLCGLWHGAGWTFVAWGLLHGIALIGHRVYASLGFGMPRSLAWLLTMTFVVFGWVLFRSTDFAMASSMIKGMLGAGGLNPGSAWALIITSGLVVLFLPRAVDVSLQKLRPHLGYSIAGGVALSVVLLIVTQGAPTAFIYFQF